jgi:hypothetical protein
VPEPHRPLSQSPFLWQMVPPGIAQVPAVAPVPLPQEPLSQSLPLWQIVVAPKAHTPLAEPVPRPHELLSQSVFLRQSCALVEQVPAVDPVPAPQELLSHSLFLWQIVAPVEQVPAVDPVPAPQELLSQSVLTWQIFVAPKEHVPAVELVPVPQVPVGPQSAFVWQTKPAAQAPFFPVPPHTPRPQSPSLWQVTTLQTPPPQVPLPHCAVDVQAIGKQVLLAQVPALPWQSPSSMHEHERLRQVLPVPQVALVAQTFGVHAPTTAPAQLKDSLGQSAPVLHGSLHCPTPPALAPWQVEAYPQSTLVRHLLAPLISALADT